HLITAYGSTNRYDGSEGEFYLLKEDPCQWRNLWDDPEYAPVRKSLLDEMHTFWPADRNEPLKKIAPV
ncbi:MAG TPA: sulfatase, partial [Hyphomicrobiaceae bacterium]|nr:sulfatase [Hyphomicrobiaceae bacterium]